MNQAPSMLKPALISGVAFGVAGAIPFVSALNCFCCALVIGSGMLASFLYSKESRAAGFAFRPGNGATVGLVTGLICGAVTGVLSAIINRSTGMNDWQEAIEQMQTAGAEIPPETLDQITTFLETSGPTVFSLGLIFVCLVCGAIFGTIGGLIGGSVFKVEPQAPVQEQAPPPPPPVG
jgi:hypothetical protein